MSRLNFEKGREIEISEYEFLDLLGRGKYGKVKLCRRKNDQLLFAVKIIRKSLICKYKQIHHVRSECLVLANINHPFLVYMEGFAQDKTYIYFFIQFVRGGELFSYLRRVHSFHPLQAQFYAAQVLCMFHYLHSLNIVYRDLKPENLLIDEKGYLKLTDFGFAKEVKHRTYTLCGTPGYLAPEMLLNKGHNSAVDWWTFGIFLYELIAGIDPFFTDDPMLTYQKILKSRVKFPRDFDQNSKSLIRHLLTKDLSKRYGNLRNGVNDIKNHRFFRGLNWAKLLNKEIEAPFIPKLKSSEDVSHFRRQSDSTDYSEELSPEKDPFLNW